MKDQLKNPTVDNFLEKGCGRCSLYDTPDCKVHRWNNELKLIRKIVQKTGLDESIKWGFPVYSFMGKNICIVGAFKEYCSIGFFKGSLLSDANKLLVSPGKNSQASRLFKFTNVTEIINLTPHILEYLQEGIEIEKKGLKVKFENKNNKIPPELELKLNESHSFKKAFEALTPGRQRGYLIHFSQAKQPATKMARIEKYYDKIMAGKGIHEY